MSETATDPFVQPVEPDAAAAIAAIVDELTYLDDYDSRILHAADYGRSLRKAHPYPAAWKDAAHFVPGCVSNVWIADTLRDGRLFFAFDADAIIPAGLIALALRVYSGRTPADILANPPDWLKESGLQASVTATRANGVASVAQRIRQIAAGC